MTHLKTKRAFLAAGAFFAAGLILWPGCATPPLPASRTPISPLKRADFSFVKEANPTRDDVIAKLGQPDEYFPDLRVACYKLNNIKRHRLVLLFGILPVGAYQDAPGIEVAMIQFDDRDREQRIQIKIYTGYNTLFAHYGRQPTLRFEAEQWVAKLATHPLNTESQPRHHDAQ